MTELIRGQRAKINGLYDDPIELTIVESEEICNVLDKIIKPKKLIVDAKEEAAT